MTRRRARTRGVVGAAGDWHRLDDTARASAARPPLSEPQRIPPARQHAAKPPRAAGRPVNGVPVPRNPRLAESMAAVGRFDALLGRAVLLRRTGKRQDALQVLDQAAAELAQVLPGHRAGREARLTRAREQLTQKPPRR